MVRLPVLLAVILGLAGCAGLMTQREPAPPEDAGLRFGGSYRFANDPCRRVGETELTAAFIDRQADLVACPIDYEGRGRFAIDSLSTERLRTENWVVYSVLIP